MKSLVIPLVTLLTTLPGMAQSFSLLPLQPSASGFNYRLLGEAGHVYVVESSNNLSLWQPLVMKSPAASSLDLLDGSASSLASRFYRLREAAMYPPGAALADLRQQWSRNLSTTTGPVRLTVAPLDPANIGTLLPLGLMVSDHVLPRSHTTYRPPAGNSDPAAYQVRAAAAGFIVSVENRNQASFKYKVIVEHTGTFYTFYDGLDLLDSTLAAQFTSLGATTSRIPIAAGQVLGTLSGLHGTELGVVNLEVTLPGLLVPEHYEVEPWQIHTVDPFDYFDEPVRSQLMAKNPRTALPSGGKTDYDVDGRLVGGWFLEGTNGYRATGLNPRHRGHLSFCPHYIESTSFIIDIGDYGGTSPTFGIIGNAPDPATVSEASGMVKYELRFVISPTSATPFAGGNNTVQGTVLAQVLPNRRLKFEAFPNQTATQVTTFTANAKTYER
ncbi:MAG: hypothetical protein ACKVY0_25530 [Prosthecobacter sp.]|uniref:hypothetical protein n=1 Tax=Prosthecobacter sp. TaxID=1965333 RepID=UPI0039035873